MGRAAGGEDPPDPPDDGWGACTITQLPAAESVDLEPTEFDTVRVHFVVPEQSTTNEISNVVLYYRQGESPLTDENAGSAVQQVPAVEQCSGDIVPGEPAWCDVTELFGNYDYQIGLAYEDECGNISNISAGGVRTPAQEFAQVDGFCFVATAAWGANWTQRVQALRWFRDVYLKSHGMGMAFVAFYYSSSPPLANSIAKLPLARAIARVALEPVTNLAALAVARR